VSAVEVEKVVDHSKKVSSMMMTKLEITAPSPKRSCANLSPNTYKYYKTATFESHPSIMLCMARYSEIGKTFIESIFDTFIIQSTKSITV
jgi:hypothetical protein